MIPAISYSEMIHLMEENLETKYWCLSTEVMDWMDENKIQIVEREFKMEVGSNQFGLLFETDEDAVAFKLRWS